MLKRIKHLLEHNAYLIAIALTLFIGITSLVSFSGIKTMSIKINNFDKIVHFGFYFLLTLSWLFATRNSFKNFISKSVLILIMISYGIIIEAFQGALTTHRQADIYDVLANSIGVLLATSMFPKLNQWFNSI